MKLVVTGGGTGGHIYPALEVARLAKERGAEIFYLGSLRGQEGQICGKLGISFQGFPSEPLYSLKTARGVKGLAKLLQARMLASKALKQLRPDVVFSTGGYSAGPVVSAARKLGIPYNIHSADSIPARSSRIYAKEAFAFTCTFRSTAANTPEVKCTRTGQPIRKDLREAAQQPRLDSLPTVLVVGGSQGSEFLNTVVPKAIQHLGRTDLRVIHAAGPKNIERTQQRLNELVLGPSYHAVPYLETEELVNAYRSATLVVARSGGTLAELALFGLPSVLIPLPSAAADHQWHNAQEFAEMKAATVLRESEASESKISQAIAAWLDSSEDRRTALTALREWDCPDATERIVELIEQAAQTAKKP